MDLFLGLSLQEMYYIHGGDTRIPSAEFFLSIFPLTVKTELLPDKRLKM